VDFLKPATPRIRIYIDYESATAIDLELFPSAGAGFVDPAALRPGLRESQPARSKIKGRPSGNDNSRQPIPLSTVRNRVLLNATDCFVYGSIFAADSSFISLAARSRPLGKG
jgi:hypothetical protein